VVVVDHDVRERLTGRGVETDSSGAFERRVQVALGVGNERWRTPLPTLDTAVSELVVAIPLLST
jgi:hypothetical protein